MEQPIPNSLAGLYYTFDSRFQMGFSLAPTWSDKIATEVPSTGRSVHYNWANNNIALREWIGERMVKHLAMRGQVIENKDWEATLEIERNDLEDLQFDLKAQEAQAMGRAAAKWKDRVVAKALLAGETTLAFDGQYFFDTDHPINMDSTGGTTYSNLLASTPLTADNYGAQRALMNSQVNEGGEAMEVRSTLLMVPPQLEDVAKRILTAESSIVVFGSNTAAAAQPNIYKNTAELLVVPELSPDPTSWYLLDTSREIKPFVMQVRKQPTFVTKDGPQEDELFWHKRVVFGCDARGNAGVTLPFLIRKMKAA